jgi:hypothetical protein
MRAWPDGTGSVAEDGGDLVSLPTKRTNSAWHFRDPRLPLGFLSLPTVLGDVTPGMSATGKVMVTL